MAGLNFVAVALAWQDICRTAGDIVASKAENPVVYQKVMAKLQATNSGTFVSEVIGLQNTGKLTDLIQAYPDGCNVKDRSAELGAKFADWALD